MRLGRRDERGDTLIEILVTVVLIGLAFTALIGSLLTSTSSSVTNRSMANLDGILRSLAEAARYEIQTQPVDGDGLGPLYSPCATSYPLVSDPYPTSGPAGTTAVVFATGFTPGQTLTVTAVAASGASSSVAVLPTPGKATSSAIVSASGSATVLFQAPSTTGFITLKDPSTGKSYTGQAMFNVLAPSSGPTGLAATSYATYVLTATVSPYPNSGSCSLSSPPTQQSITLTLASPLPTDNGAGDQISFIVGNFAPDPVVISNSAIQGVANLTTGLTAGSRVTHLSVTALQNSVPSGSVLVMGGSEQATTSAAAAAGATTISINSFTPNQGYPSGTQIALNTPTNTVPATLTFTATVTNPDGSPATSGTITWSIPSKPSGVNPCATTVSVSNGTATCKMFPSIGQQGLFQLSATYTNGSSYPSGSQAQSTVTLGATQPAMPPPVPAYSPSTGLVFTETISGASGYPAPDVGCSGQCVTWSIGAESATGSSVTPCPASGGPTDNGLASSFTCTVANPAMGTTYTAIATYAGNGYYSSASSNVAITVPVLQASGTQTGTSNSIAVTIAGTPSATGSITCAPTPNATGSVSYGAFTAGSPSTASCSWTGTANSPYTTLVTYNPDSGSSSTYSSESITIPSVVITPANAGDALSFTVVVSAPAGGNAPTGTMACTPNPSPSGTVTVTPLTPGVGSSTAICSFQGTPTQSYNVVMTYTPDGSSSATYGSASATSTSVTAP